MDNKNVFAKNLKKYMELNDKSRKDVSSALDVSYYTVTDWVNGKKYPRMDKVEKMANYFGILKSDLIEEKSEQEEKITQKNNALVGIISRLRTDDEFLNIVKMLSSLDDGQLNAVKQMLIAFVK
nr:MAG TPA: Repressor protein CI [Caudoviricetes sp.]